MIKISKIVKIVNDVFNIGLFDHNNLLRSCNFKMNILGLTF